jgi:hypothetical protein
MPKNPFTYEDTYMGLPIIPEPDSGNYLDILDAIRARMEDMVDRHSKVFGVLLGLNLPAGSGTVPHNRHAQTFVDAFSRYLKGRGIDYHHVWVREQPTAEAQPHWHMFLALDGNRTLSFQGGHLRKAETLWAETLNVEQASGLVHLCDWQEATGGSFPVVGNGGVMIKRNSPEFPRAYGLLFRRASYLAKQRTKEFTPKGLRKFSVSHLG